MRVPLGPWRSEEGDGFLETGRCSAGLMAGNPVLPITSFVQARLGPWTSLRRVGIE